MPSGKRSRLTLQTVETMPPALAVGVLYTSRRFGIAVHLCCCGCGLRVVTPLSPADWVLTVDANGPTLRPSISNSDYPCRSHYWITSGEVEWSYELTRRQVQATRSHTARARAQQAARTQQRVTSAPGSTSTWWQRAWAWLRG